MPLIVIARIPGRFGLPDHFLGINGLSVYHRRSLAVAAAQVDADAAAHRTGGYGMHSLPAPPAASDAAPLERRPIDAGHKVPVKGPDAPRAIGPPAASGKPFHPLSPVCSHPGATGLFSPIVRCIFRPLSAAPAPGAALVKGVCILRGAAPPPWRCGLPWSHGPAQRRLWAGNQSPSVTMPARSTLLPSRHRRSRP